MVDEGRAQYADPSSVIKGGALLLSHVGYQEEAKKLEMALDICGQLERKIILTGRSNGATGSEFADYIMDTIQDPELEEKWNSFSA
jgi:isocitrate dehydrogenase (NAD+)